MARSFLNTYAVYKPTLGAEKPGAAGMELTSLDVAWEHEVKENYKINIAVKVRYSSWHNDFNICQLKPVLI